MSPEDEHALIERAHREIGYFDWFNGAKTTLFSCAALFVVIVMTSLIF